MNDRELAAAVRQAALDNGFDACGIIRAEEMHGYAGAIARRIDRFPNSRPMYGSFAGFAEPAASVPWAEAVVVCARWYGHYRIPKALHGVVAKAFCVDERKDPRAWEYQGRQRFEAALEGLGLRQTSKSDFGITAMRWAAAQAGIGTIRKNNFFYGEKGSWYNLDVFIIDRPLELKSAPALRPCPEKCGLCMTSCPTAALAEPFQTNGVACISYLTSMGTCAPDKPHYDKCGGWIFGCDACQDACPFNRQSWFDADEYPGLQNIAPYLSYERLLAMDYDVMRSLLPRKFWYIQPNQVWRWKCNALNAMRNTYEKRYRPYIEAALQDERPEVRDMAAWVLERTAGAPPALSPTSAGTVYL